MQKQLNRSRCCLWADLCGSMEPCFRLGQDQTNPFTASRGDKKAVRLFAKRLWSLVYIYAYFESGNLGMEE